MAGNEQVKFALEFPQGRVLFMQNSQAVYFLPHQGAEAFMVWGERKELFGKNAISVAKSEIVQTPYNIVYEFGDNGALADARLINQAESFRGKLADAATVGSVNAALAEGKIKLYTSQDMQPAKVYNVAQFKDGRMLIQLSAKNELYLGTPGNYQKLDAQLYMQGGCSMYYKMSTGEPIELPWGLGGPRRGENPKFNGEELVYLDVPRGAEPSQFGLDLSTGIVPLNPFSPGLPPAPAPKARFMPEGPHF